MFTRFPVGFNFELLAHLSVLSIKTLIFNFKHFYMHSNVYMWGEIPIMAVFLHD